MEYFSQNLKNEEDLVCVLCREGKMPRERTSAKHLRQNGTTEPEQGLRDAAAVVLLLRAPPCSSTSRSVAQRSAEGIRKPRMVALVILSSDMAHEISTFIIYLHLTIIMSKILLQIYF